MPTPTSTSAELKRRRSDGGRSQKLILFKRGKAISGVIVKALYLLLLFLTKELRLCHQGQEYTLTLSGVRGTSIVDRTHVLVVERFSSSRFFKVHMTQKKIWHLSKETSLQIVLKHFEEGIPKVAFLRRRDFVCLKRFLQLTRCETLGGPLHKGTKRLHLSKCFQQNICRCLFIPCFNSHNDAFPSSVRCFALHICTYACFQSS